MPLGESCIGVQMLFPERWEGKISPLEGGIQRFAAQFCQNGSLWMRRTGFAPDLFLQIEESTAAKQPPVVNSAPHVAE